MVSEGVRPSGDKQKSNETNEKVLISTPMKYGRTETKVGRAGHTGQLLTKDYSLDSTDV